MASGTNNQRKLLLVHFPKGGNGGTQSITIAADNGLPVPMFKDLKTKVPLVAGCVIIVQILITFFGYFVLNKENSEDFQPEGSDELKTFWNTRRILAFGNSMCFSTIFLAFTGLASMILWEFNVMKRAPQLSIELGFHRMMRLAFLTFIVTLGLFNTVHCGNLYTLLFEMVLIFIFFVVECTYHVLLFFYFREFNKYAYQRQKQNKQLVKDVRAKNPDEEKVIADLKKIQQIV